MSCFYSKIFLTLFRSASCSGRTLKFADEENVEQSKEELDVGKICKILKKMELTDTETSDIIELMLKKEENSR